MRGQSRNRKGLFPPASAVEDIKSVRCVCPSVRPSVRLSICLLFSALTVERFDIRTRKLVGTLTLMISRTSSKVIGQRSRSSGWKTWFYKVADEAVLMNNVTRWWNSTKVWCHGVTSRHDVTAWHHSLCYGLTMWIRTKSQWAVIFATYKENDC